MVNLEGRTILVTGAEGHLGSYLADALIEQGATVVGTWISEEDKAAADERSKHADEVNYYRVDLTEPEEVEAFADDVESEYGPVSGIVNLVGAFGKQTFKESSAEDLHGWFDVMAVTVFNTCQAFVDQLEETEGSIVNFTSDRVFMATPETFPYNLAKAAVKTMTETIANDLDNVRANAIAPYFIATPEKREEGGREDYPHWNISEDIIELASFLLESPSVDGEVIKPNPHAPGSEPDRQLY